MKIHTDFQRQSTECPDCPKKDGEDRKVIEIEGKGVDYERYALNKLFHKLIDSYKIKSVLEIPAKGEKAMPSLYSLAFGEAGCPVTLMNAEEKSRRVWSELGYKVNFLTCTELDRTELAPDSYDLVWHFMYLAHHEKKIEMLNEMSRLSNRYVMYIAVNRFNVGFFSHRTAHKIFRVPWNHGAVNFMNPFYVTKFFANNGIHVLKTGVVDTPPYPDSLGFRDMKLHKKNVDLNKIDWDSRTIQWMKSGHYPLKLKLLYFFEWLPLPFILKLPYAHLFYVIGEKK